ncbi:MAG: glycosyltransferase family 87 protein [Bryobacteraceae bacterium]
MKRFLHWSPIALGVLFLLLLLSLQKDRALQGKNDFVAFYAGAKLAGTPALYDAKANIELIDSTLGVRMQRTLYIRHPFYAAVLKPLAWFPYLTSYAIFTVATLGSFLWFIWRFSKQCPSLPFFAAFSIPLLTAESNGQDPAFLVAIVGASILLTRTGRDFTSGMVLSLCILKPHLFVFIPILLLIKKRWSMVAGGIAGTAALTLLGIVVNGPGSIVQWIEVMRNPWINAEAEEMPNLHGLAAALHGGGLVEASLAAVVVLGFVWLTTKTDSYELLLGAALVGGLLANFHAAISDDLLLIPVLVLVTGASSLIPLRVVSALILTPIPYFLAMAGPPYSAALPAALLGLFGLFVLSESRLRSRFKTVDGFGVLQT